jgi:hypothetical protein
VTADPSLGFALTRQNTHVQLILKADGGVSLVDLRTLAALDFDAAERDELREMLDRAAMPGQVLVKHGPGCRCTPCKAEPSYRADRAATAPGSYAGHLRFPTIPAGPDDPHRLRMESAQGDGEDCGCGLGSARCRAAEDGDLGG